MLISYRYCCKVYACTKKLLIFPKKINFLYFRTSQDKGRLGQLTQPPKKKKTPQACLKKPSFPNENNFLY